MILHRTYGVGIIVATLSLLLLLSSTAQAFTANFYNNSDGITSSPKPSIAGAVGYTQWVKESRLRVGIYFTASSGQVKIVDYGYCTGNSKLDDGYTGGSRGQAVTKYDFSTSAGGNIKGLDTGDGGFTGEVYGKKNVDCKKDRVVKFSNLQRDGETGLYRVTLTVTRNGLGAGSGNIQNTFRLESSGSGAKIAHLGSTGGSGAANRGDAVTLAQVNSSPDYSDYRIAFGSDCSVLKSGNGRVSIRLFDLDNNPGPGSAQGTGGKIRLRLQQKARDGSGWSNVTLYKKATSGATWPSGTFYPTGADDDDLEMWFQPNYNYQYRLELDHVYKGNAIQYNTPFDGIFSDTPCKWTANPTTEIKVGSGAWTTGTVNFVSNKNVTVQYRHKVTQATGPGRASLDAWAQRNYKGNLSAQGMLDFGAKKNVDLSGNGDSWTYSNAITVPKSTANGRKFCQRLRVSATNQSGGGKTGNQVCAVASNGTSPGQWNLTPSLTGVKSGSIIATGDQILPAGEVAAAGSIDPAGTHTYGIAVFSPQTGVKPEQAEDSLPDMDGGNVCDRINATYGISNCNAFTTKDNQVIKRGVRHAVDGAYSIPSNATIGQRYCFVTFVQYPSWDSPVSPIRWRFSTTSCVIVGKKPTIHVTGHDVRTNGDITTSIFRMQESPTVPTIKNFGSWAEYGVIANGCNSSGALTSGGFSRKGTTSGFGSDVNGFSLTLSNASGCDGLPGNGNFGAEDFTGASFAQMATYKGNGGEVVKYSDIMSSLGSKSTVYLDGATLIIDRDISYGGPYDTMKDIPALRLQAKNIIVSADVTRIDAALIADGNLLTCNPGIDLGDFDNILDRANAPVSTSDSNLGLYDTLCNRPLVFNNAVQAGNIYLYRTGGAWVDNPDAPAETFNMRASALLSAAAPSDNPVAITDLVTDLPPRF